MDLDADLRRKAAALDARLRALRSVLVAFSGGADSALLLAAAARALGPRNVLAATAVSPSLPGEELGAAQRFCADLGVTHVTPATHELDRAGYRANAGDRCAFCKTELVETLLPLAIEHGVDHVVTGTNADDVVAGFRPGIGAAARLGALTPLADVGMTKAEVRQLSRDWNLPTWDKPQAACLASRIAYGVEVSRERLERVEAAERQLRSALESAGIAVRNLRVRDLGDRARVEFDREQVAAVLARPEVLAAVRGWDRVEVDPLGFRSGSMNEALVARGA